jgi:UDP-N-acetylmuramoyl-L-alanyl-D-glutamate--2,6-diaminopimelate ligase
MLLGDLIAGTGSELASGTAVDLPAAALEVEISALAYRADRVSPGALFFCVRGFNADGHDFASDAVARGAAALVCERPLGLGVPELIVPEARAEMPLFAASFFGHPTKQLRLIGVTGTNGKTTTTFVLRDILEHAGWGTGMLGTVQSVIGGHLEPVERTTPEAVELQHSFRRMVDEGDAACVMEVSSHALELHRVDGSHFDTAVFTNLSQDHLDFHGTLEEYFGAKRRLFVGHRSGNPRNPVINVDDSWGRRLTAELAEAGHTSTITFAIEQPADFSAHDVELRAVGSRFTCRTRDGEVEVTFALPGLFNVYNALGSIAAASTVGIDLATAAEGVAAAGKVPGRFEPVDAGQEFSVLVDYAHTPESLESVLVAARDLVGKGGRLICVFGAGGDRDREKRPLMGAAARRLADRVIVTSDNPRSEEPEAIIEAILAGARSPGAGERSELAVEPDRRQAIVRAVATARRGDVVLIAGKGHEQGQELAGGRKVPFDDREVARQELRALLEASGRDVPSQTAAGR